MQTSTTSLRSSRNSVFKRSLPPDESVTELVCCLRQRLAGGGVGQDVVCPGGQHSLRRLSVEAAGGHLRRDAVPGRDALHADFKRCRDHAELVALGLCRRADDDRAVQHKELCPRLPRACLAARMRRTISGWVSASSAAFPSGVAKARSASRRAVKSAVFLYNICPEALSQLGQQR